MEIKFKICSTCKCNIDITTFHKYKSSKDGYTHRCKSCVSRKKIVPNNEKICSICCKTKKIENFNKRKNGKFGVASVCKKCFNLKQGIYRHKNRERINKTKNEWRKHKKETDPIFKLKCNMRCRMYDFLQGRKIQKNNKTFEIIGCTPQELKIYIENQFTKGMSWKNYGYYGWHVDHKTPLYVGKTKKEIYKLFHYTNLQPLWKNDNFKKGKQIIEEK